MGTVVSMEVVGADRADAEDAIDRAMYWFVTVEEHCSRFDERSELRQVCARVGKPVEVSAMLFECVRFALELAHHTGGAFDPTVGDRMAARGFDRHYRTGARVARSTHAEVAVSYRDVEVDEFERTITVARPLTLDVGAVAKGLAIDLAARELRDLEHFAIDAGGDLYLAGCNAEGAPWSAGVRHPRIEGVLLEVVHVSNAALCTSGDYERRAPTDPERAHHILDARTGGTAGGVASVSVLSPVAMVADGLATAAFALGPADGIALLERHEVGGMIVTPALEQFVTRSGWP